MPFDTAGRTFYPLHLLFDKHHEEQVELVDTIAERIQTLGGTSEKQAWFARERLRGDGK